MTKNTIQEKRMRGYFIQAAKEILRGEGLRAVSVRNIAERAGYSYATLYNYFDDLKELIFECITDFKEESTDFVKERTKNSERGLTKINDIVIAYANFFVQHPGIFELFYIEKPTDIAKKQPTLDLIYSLLDKLCLEEWIYCIQNDIKKMDEAERMKSEIRFLVPGMLLLYLNRRRPETYDQFLGMLKSQLNYILHKE
ncbi:MAG: TetR/AcrR family transcriptional regulator [Melioribacteraceae bacterium]|nr:TetR/AcrR family transcriptional regulator [Melioribacteraceae bacterium]